MKGKMLNSLANVLYAPLCSLGIHLSENECKFFSTITASYISRAHPALNHFGSSLSSYVSTLVTKGIVKLFEVIQIKASPRKHFGLSVSHDAIPGLRTPRDNGGCRAP